MPGRALTFSFIGDTVVDGPKGRAEVRGVQPSLLLARLVLDRPTPLARDLLVEMLWPGSLPDHWAGAARKVVSRARKALTEAGLDEGALRSSSGQLTLHLDGPVEVDLELAAEDASAAELALAADDAAGATDLASRALARLDGPFLAGAEGPWVERRRAPVDALRQRCRHTLIEAAHRSGDLADAVDQARRAVDADAFDELATRQLMRALVARGSRAGALAAYENLRLALDQHLGLRPGPETEAAYLDLLGEQPAMEQPRVPVPPRRIVPADQGPFVGRQPELTLLRREWAATADGVRIVVVAGEAGIGKTRLVAQLAETVAVEGATVLWARCDAEVSIAHGPFADLVRQLVDTHPDLLARLGPVAARLVALIPEIAPSADDDRSTSGEQRARLARAVTTAFSTAADRPLLVVVDDLHWADGDTMALLGHVVARLTGVPCLFVVTLRESTAQVASTLAELASAVPITTLDLDGLDHDALRHLIEDSEVDVAGDPLAAAEAIHQRTGGNPLYVTQLVREAEASGGPFVPDAVPFAVTLLLERRLAALDRDAAGILTLAAVIGSEFELSTIAACSALDEDRVLDLAEDLARQRLLTERGAGRFGFTHALVRDAVLATMSQTRRQRVHQRVAAVLAAGDADPGVLAHHLLASGPAAADDAVAASLAAGDAALRRSAWATASDHFTNAARLEADDEQGCEALTGLGLAQRGLGDPLAARDSLEQALDLARRAGRPRALAAATLAMVGGGGRGVALDLADQHRADLLRRALDGLGPDDPDLAVPVLSELALSLVLADAVEEREALCERCLAEARRWGDPAGLLTALRARRIVLMGPAGTEARFADGQEAVALAHSTIPAEPSIAAHLGLVEDLLELGHRQAADVELAQAEQLAARLDHPYWSWSATSWRALLTIIDGDLPRAEALAAEALAHQAGGDHPEAVAAFGVNLVAIRLFDGRAGEVVDLLASAADENPQIPAYRAVLALCLAESGRRAEAAEVFEGFARTDFDLPRDSNWLLAAAVLADCCATLGDADRAPTLRKLLDPWGERHVVLNCYGGGGAYWGPVAHHLGRLHAVEGDASSARTLLDQAADRSRGFGATLFAERSEAARQATFGE